MQRQWARLARRGWCAGVVPTAPRSLERVRREMREAKPPAVRGPVLGCPPTWGSHSLEQARGGYLHNSLAPSIRTRSATKTWSHLPLWHHLSLMPARSPQRHHFPKNLAQSDSNWWTSERCRESEPTTSRYQYAIPCTNPGLGAPALGSSLLSVAIFGKGPPVGSRLHLSSLTKRRFDLDTAV